MASQSYIEQIKHNDEMKSFFLLCNYLSHIFPFGGFSWFLVVYLELLLDSLGIFVSLGRSREWLPLSHIHLGGKKWKWGNWKNLIRHEYLSMGWDGIYSRLHTYPKPTSPSLASITSLMPLLGKRGEVIECRKDRETGSQDQGRERHSFLK